MLHAGLVAHTPEGAALCFQEFCRLGNLESDAQIYPDISIDHIAFGRSLPAWNAGDYSAVRAVLALSIERLARAGADFFLCPANTAHVALECAGPRLALPGLHIAQVAAAAAARQQRKMVGVLGTRFTLQSGLYERALSKHGIQAVAPEPADQSAIDEMIFGDLVRGVFTQTARDTCRRIIDRLAKRGCDAAALACTEIPLLLSPEQDIDLPQLDTTRLLARAALEVAAEHADLPAWRGGPIG